MSGGRWLAPIGPVAVLAALSVAMILFSNVSTSSSGTAPSFSVRDIDGKVISSENLKGKVIVLHLAVIYCGGVITDSGKYQIEQVREANERHGEEAAFITVTSENCPTTDLEAIRQQYNISWPLVNDWPDMKIYGPYADYFSHHGDPTLVFIDTSGKVVKHSGRTSAADIDKAIDAAITGAAKPAIVTTSYGFAGMLALGALTSIAPCSIALLATMLAFLISRRSGDDKSGKNGGRTFALQGLSIGLYFTLGTGLVFLFLGFLVGYLEVFVSLSPVFFGAAGALLIILGLNSAFSLFERLGNLFRSRSGGKDASAPGWAQFVRKTWGRSPEAGALLLGILFSLAWAPCAISLVLPVIVLMLASKVGIVSGGALLFFFGLGHAVPIIPIAMVTETSRARLGEKYLKAGKAVTLVFGLAVVVMGALFILRGFGIYLW